MSNEEYFNHLVINLGYSTEQAEQELLFISDEC